MSDEDLYFITKESTTYKTNIQKSKQREKKIQTMNNIKEDFENHIHDKKTFAMFLGYISNFDDISYMKIIISIYKCNDKVGMNDKFVCILVEKLNKEQIIRKIQNLDL